jgi:hypothetical protein
VQERVATIAWKGVEKDMIERGQHVGPQAKCTVSNHAGSFLQTMVIWISCVPISKFGDLNLHFWKSGT